MVVSRLSAQIQMRSVKATFALSKGISVMRTRRGWAASWWSFMLNKQLKFVPGLSAVHRTPLSGRRLAQR